MANIYDMSDTWNDGATTFTAIKMDVTDTASASDSLLMDLQVGGSSVFKVSKSAGPLSIEQGTAAGRARLVFPQYSEIRTENNRIGFSDQNSNIRVYVEDGITVRGLGKIGFSSGTVSTGLSSATDVSLRRDGAGILAQREGTNAQTFNLYNTYTDASNYERGFMKWNSNVLEIGTEAAGTGTLRGIKVGNISAGEYFQTDSVNNVSYIYAGGSRFSFNAYHFKMGVQAGSPDAGLQRLSAGSLKITNGGSGAGELIFIVPTTDPGITGALWNNGGTLSISA